MFAILNLITNTILDNRFQSISEAEEFKSTLVYIDGWVLTSHKHPNKKSKYDPTPEWFEVTDVSQ